MLIIQRKKKKKKSSILQLSVETIEPILSRDDIIAAQKTVHEIYCDEKILDYIVALVFATRKPEQCGLGEIAKYITYGVSPRATLALHKASRAHAFLKKRTFVTPDDVKVVAPRYTSPSTCSFCRCRSGLHNDRYAY